MKNNLLNAILSCKMNYETYQNSFSPIYSNFGLGLDGNFAGIRTLYMHYNRSTHTVFEPLLSLENTANDYIPEASRVTYLTDDCDCEIAFYDTDCILIKCKTQKSIDIFSKTGKSVTDMWIAEENDDCIIMQGYSENGDERDPDKEVAVMAGAEALKGRLKNNNGKISAIPEDGEIYLAFAFDVMNVNSVDIKRKLKNAPNSIDCASEITQNWISENIKDLNVSFETEKEETVFVKAVITLIFNLAKATGNLEGFISSFPNRGGYPTHFTWDTCFQNLAYEMMNTDIAKDSLFQLFGSIRPDGKIPQFLCSTWGRPHDVQPALLGWAVKRLYNKTNDIKLIEKIFEPLEKNNHWWLTQRITSFGVIKCADGLETGQDNSPRFDKGTVLAVDMNSYLLNQIKATAEFARILGFPDKALYWENEAKKLNDNIIRYLYNEQKNMFFDAFADSAEQQTLLTASGLIPLWAGVTIPEEKAKAMIKNYLLNPEYFCGNVPFPCVAYTEAVYDPVDWWRGPMWMPEAWLMLEVLKSYGFNDEYNEISSKLYDILLHDGVLHEHFNSKTGEGMGNIEQGWTAAIFIKMFINRKTNI